MLKAQIHEIYNKFLVSARLSETARKDLKEKRGFTGETIDTFRLVSGNPLYVKNLQELRGEHGDEAMEAAGLLTKNKAGKTVFPSQILDKDRPIIPYLDSDGQFYLLRPHKFGLQGVQVEPFCSFLLKDRPQEIVLTEGEFKAIACHQWGIPAVAIPGISSFSGKHYPRLVELLKSYGVKKITVIFDNEVKDDPSLPNYKEQPAKRHDTNFWAYMMAYKLGREGFIAKVGKLPDEWRQNGKIDFDGALAQGKTREDILRVISQAQAPAEFRKGWDGEERRILERKIKKYFMANRVNPPVKRGDEPGKYNSYLAARPSKTQAGTFDYEQISNFVISIETSFYTPDGIIREVTFVNEFGEKSPPFFLAPEDMVSSQYFAKFCASKGNLLWYGKQPDLIKIWELEMAREDTGVIVYQPDRVGEVEPGIWLFANIAIKGGKTYKPDERGIFWIDGKGYLPRPLTGDNESDPLPELCLDGNLDKIRDIARKMKENVNSYVAYAGLGWIIACIFGRVIFAEFGFFPILFAHGKYESGKTTFLRWLFAFLGIETTGKSLAESTQNFIMRSLAYYSSLASWFDEYRNEGKITAKNGYLRSAYNRQSAGKGIKATFGAKGYEVAGALAISGEESPRDAGLSSRCCYLRLSEAKRTGAHFNWLNETSPEFSWLTYYLISNYEELADKIIKEIRDLNEALREVGVPDRTAGNWAIVGGAFYAVISQDENFIRWIRKECTVTENITKAEHMLAVFWEDVNILCSRGALGSDHFRTGVPYQGREYFGFWFSAIYEAFAKNYRQTTGREPFNKASILQYLKDEEYFAGDQVPAWLSGATKRLTLVDQANPKLDENLREIIEQTKNLEKRDLNKMDFSRPKDVPDYY